MSMETLVSDLKANIAELSKLSALSTVDDIVRHHKDVVWPTLEAIVEELGEIDGCVKDMVLRSVDIIQPDTGAVLAAVVTGAVTVAGALKSRITREAEPQLYKVIEELESNCKEAEEILDESVLEYDEEEDGDEDDDDDAEEDEEETP